MAGKYTHLIDRLKRLLPADAKYQEKVEETKKLILLEHAPKGGTPPTSLSPSTLVVEYAETRAELSRLEKETYNANLRLEAVTQMTVAAYEAEDISLLNVTGVGKLGHQKEPYAQVKDKEKFRLWCVTACQLCGLHKDKHPIPEQTAQILNLHPDHAPVTLETSLQLWPSTMNSITKERLLKGYPEPDGVEAFYKDKLVLTREKE